VISRLKQFFTKAAPAHVQVPKSQWLPREGDQVQLSDGAHAVVLKVEVDGRIMLIRRLTGGPCEVSFVRSVKRLK